MEFDQVKYRKILFDTFEAFIKTCETYNLRYFCAGGTVLGAVRHQNIIPWDDDIDVFMPREDYMKIIGLDSEIKKTGFSVISAYNSNQFATFAKFYNTNTTLWELKEIPFVYGVYIDIFPLDESDDSLDVFLKKYKKLRNAQRYYQLSQMRFSINDVREYWIHGDKKYFYKGLLATFLPRFMTGYFRRKILSCEKLFMGQTGKKMVCPYGEYFKKEYQEKKWYDDYAIAHLGELKVRIPIGFEDFLRYVYGDYMKLPPVEKRVSHHYHYYVDLEKGMTLEDVRFVLRDKS